LPVTDQQLEELALQGDIFRGCLAFSSIDDNGKQFIVWSTKESKTVMETMWSVAVFSSAYRSSFKMEMKTTLDQAMRIRISAKAKRRFFTCQRDFLPK
jgi:hypothetical protein